MSSNTIYIFYSPWDDANSQFPPGGCISTWICSWYWFGQKHPTTSHSRITLFSSCNRFPCHTSPICSHTFFSSPGAALMWFAVLSSSLSSLVTSLWVPWVSLTHCCWLHHTKFHNDTHMHKHTHNSGDMFWSGHGLEVWVADLSCSARSYKGKVKSIRHLTKSVFYHKQNGPTPLHRMHRHFWR